VVLKRHKAGENPYSHGREVEKCYVGGKGRHAHFEAWKASKKRMVDNGRLFRAANLVHFGYVEIVADSNEALHIADVYSETTEGEIYTITQHLRGVYDESEGIYKNVYVKECDCQDIKAPRYQGSKLCKHVLAVWLQLHMEQLNNPEAAAAAAAAEAAAEAAQQEEIKARKAKRETWAKKKADQRQREYSAWRNSSDGAAAYIRKAAANGATSFRQDIWERAHGRQPDATGQHLPPAEAVVVKQMQDRRQAINPAQQEANELNSILFAN